MVPGGTGPIAILKQTKYFLLNVDKDEETEKSLWKMKLNFRQKINAPLSPLMLFLVLLAPERINTEECLQYWGLHSQMYGPLVLRLLHPLGCTWLFAS